MGAINSNVIAALKGWITTEAKSLLEQIPKNERGMSHLIFNVSALMMQCGVAEAEELMQEMVATRRAELGDRHPRTLMALGNLANNLVCQGKYTEAEPLFREGLKAARDTVGNNNQVTQIAVINLGAVLQELGRLDEAEPLCVEAAMWFRENGPQYIKAASVGALVELRRRQGRLAEAEEELGSLVAETRATLGPQHVQTLDVEAIAARLKHAQPDDAVAGAAELRTVVEKMGEFLGAAHFQTVKWKGVLDEMEQSC